MHKKIYTVICLIKAQGAIARNHEPKADVLSFPTVVSD